MSQGNIYTLEVKFSNGAYGIIVSLILYGLLSGEATLYDNNGNPVSIIPN